ncbi:2-amino-4-hydroxy-6-hydroxymethyldihydropteridine diphosphokinase [Thermodesulfobacteriota bacterium]
MSCEHVAFIGVGSNMGARRAHCTNGLEALDRHARCSVVRTSPFYLTEPVGLEEQPWFVNCAARVETGLEPEDLFEVLKGIEHSAGRREGSVRFGPRVLDMDILFYDKAIIQSSNLTVPHPRMHERRFVLRPLCDIEPQWVHPVLGRSVAGLLDGLRDGGKGVILYP